MSLSLQNFQIAIQEPSHMHINHLNAASFAANLRQRRYNHP